MPLARAGAVALLLSVAVPAVAPLRAQGGEPLLLRAPALSATEICFSFAGDIWIVPRAGGTASRLTASPGNETDCQFSADGRAIAYTGSVNGNTDVYVVPVAGGAPKRLTYHPASDQVRGWTPDGKVMFASNRDGESSNGTPARLYVQGVDEVAPTAIDLPSGYAGSFSADGKRLAYMPIANANAIWKRYRGGRTTPIWIATLSDASIERVPRENSTDMLPMWVGDTVFFLSDRDGPTTLYAYELGSKRVTKRVDNRGLDIKSASAGPGAIVYEQFGAIRMHDLTTGQDTPVAIRLGGELSEALPQWARVGQMLQHSAISPTGVRAAFEARGEVISVPAKKGDARDVTRTVAATERFPTWSPDGQTLAYFSDANGPYHLELRGQTGMGAPRVIKLGDDDTYYYTPVYSPDGSRIAFANSRNEIWIAEVASGKLTKVDVEPIASFREGGTPLSWSPDSRWLAYARSGKNRLSAVFVYDVGRGTFTQVTDGMSDARSPAFDASGKYLWFVASTDAGPATDFSMTTFDHPVTRTLYAVVLPNDIPSPLAPESDEEKAKGDSAAKSAARAAAGDVAGAKRVKPDKNADAMPTAPPRVRIDFDGIDQRTVAMPIPARDYAAVVAGKAGVVYLAESPLVPVDQQNGDGPGVTLHKFDLDERKASEVVSGVNEFDISRDGEKLLYAQQGKWTIASLAQPVKPGDGVLATGDIQVETDPRAEWKEMYHDALRLQRAFFYDPNYHGLDLAGAEKKYAAYLDGLGSRADLDYLFQEVFGNLTVGHLFVGSPPGPPNGTPRNGVLGADYALDNGRWKFARVYAGESWNPQFRAPLTQPGVNVHDGEYLLAVNGQELTKDESPDEALQGTAGKSVLLRVGPSANGAGARDVTVVPLGSETLLRHLAWIDRNRRTVDKLSGGKLAYLYIPNTANEGYTRFNRYFFAQQDKQGAVVDERYNAGGNIADYMIEYLRRQAPFNYMSARTGADVPIPAGAIYGPKVMLINEYAGSGGDELPWLFHRFQVGQLVGKRTWGGLVGIGGYPALMDGGGVTAPRIALWTPESEYAIENHGVAPDVDVDLDPAAWRAGHDTQLEKGVAILMEQLGKSTPVAPKRPAYPTWARPTTGDQR